MLFLFNCNDLAVKSTTFAENFKIVLGNIKNLYYFCSTIYNYGKTIICSIIPLLYMVS